MNDFADNFGPFGNKVWLNTAHQGALPRAAAEAAHAAVGWKVTPFEMTQERFDGVPVRMRQVLGRLIDAPPADVILANSCSYGLHLMANGYPWKRGDEVLVVRGDFPSTILPWLGLESRGVVVRTIEPTGQVVTPEDLEAHRTPRTRVFCTTWVHSFTGYAVDEQALGEWCRAHDVAFVLNASQGLGARPLRVADAPVDAVTSVGFKWLCGPYGTGFCWIDPALRERLEYNKAYWLAMQTAADLEEAREPQIRDDLGARKYDIFGTANFFNFTAWTASVACLLELGLEGIRDHDQRLVSRLIDGLDASRFELLSPAGGRERTTLVLFSHREPDRNRAIYQRLRDAGIYVALRMGRLRVSPHVYNTPEHVDRLLDVLHG